MRRRSLPSQPDAEALSILKRMAKGEKLFQRLGDSATIGHSREHAKLIPSKLFTNLQRGEWIELNGELEEWQLTLGGRSALSEYEHRPRPSSRTTRRKKRF